MKLFSPQESDNKKQSEIARDVARVEILRDEIIKAQKELGEVKAQFDLTMAKQRQYFAEEEEKHIREIDKLNKEVKALEERQKVARFPIAPAERKAYDNLQKSEQTLLEIKLQKEKNEEIEEALTDKLISLSDKDEELFEREKKVRMMEESATNQKLHLETLSKSLSEKWADLYKRETSLNESFAKREREIELHEKDLSGREDVLLYEKEQVKKDKEKIASDRITLKTAFLELKRKKLD